MLVSLREAAQEFHAGKVELSTDLEIHIGDAVTTWRLRLITNLIHEKYGTLGYYSLLHRAEGPLGMPNWHPDVMEGYAVRDVEVVREVFGVDLDARVWTQRPNPPRVEDRHERSANG